MSSVQSPSTAIRNRVQAAVGKWTGSLLAEDRPLFERFVEAALDRLRGPYLAQHHPSHVLRQLETAYHFTKVRPATAVKVQVQPGETSGIVTMTNMPDQPFIVDTCRLFLKRNAADYQGGFNIVLPLTRDGDGRLVAIGEGSPESIVLLEAEDTETLHDRAHAAEVLREHLTLARAMVADFRSMTRAIERTIEKFEVTSDRSPESATKYRESGAFLQWLLNENFVFMGVEVVQGGASSDKLGIQTQPGAYYNDASGEWPAAHAAASIQVRKGLCESPIHRAGRIDEVLVTLPGQWDDQHLLIRGMFTYRAVTQPSRNVPILRRILANILEVSESKPGSFRYKGLANVFDSLPTEFLFTATEDAIVRMVDLVFESEQQQEVGVTFLRLGPQSTFSLIAMPKAQFSDELRRDIQLAIVDTFRATYSDHGLFVGRYDTVLLHFYLTGVADLGDERLTALTEQIRALATPWIARVYEALTSRFDERTADRLTETWGTAFPADYVRVTTADRGIDDILILEKIGQQASPSVDIFLKGEQAILRMYEPVDLYLTDILPVLDNLGLLVHDAYPIDVTPRGGGNIRLDTFRLAPTPGVDLPTFMNRRTLLIDAIEAIFSKQVESDVLDGLVVRAGLDWREVDVIRGYSRYLRQLQLKVVPTRIREILLARPAACADLVLLFKSRFDPAVSDEARPAAIARATEAVQERLRQIRARDEDLVFRTLARLIDATLRTNFYRKDRPYHYLSFKFDVRNSKAHVGASHMFEIYVHNKDVEGVHLRFGPVARGGLRWSDRDDFRTEVLGLATTQQKKNVVIVPEGSKGGFYLRNPSADGPTRRREADRLYQTFIRGLLDLTDNAAGGVRTRPPGVVCHDGFDPYLVVAADKGTAHLSDTANALSLQYGFWLGDAFASGGSNGYDHKKVGITARGAWVLVRRHFAEMGIDPYQQPFTCVGVGDMGGDVFGNGLIETPHARLLAAFNHIHIFLDPDPDPAASFAERKRMFDIAGREAGWDHYNAALISAGGGVFERSAKTIPLSPQVRAMLGLDVEEAAPNVVINHILKMKVDLLWNGGIGTYVKASFETDADADDSSNDELRVSANELRCRIVGEGGNLGFTQMGRIEAGLLGVRLNTDAIDNSGGVDLSDHEVNLKILLSRVVADGRLSLDERNTLLEALTDEVASLVLANNDAHGRQLSRDQIRSRLDIYQFAHAISFIEKKFGIKRESLDLPSAATLAERGRNGQGLTRPELAVLGAYVKMYVYTQLMASNPRSIPGFDEMLVSYFPKKVQELYPNDVQGHMLANEIAMTVATTRIMADVGAANIPLLIETTGASVSTIVSALFGAQALARMDQVRATLEELKPTTALPTLSEAFVRIMEGARMVALDWLSARGQVPTTAELESMIPAVDRYYDLLSPEAYKVARARLAELLKEDVPEAAASLVVKARFLNLALLAHQVATSSGADLPDAIVKVQTVGQQSGLLPIVEDLAVRPAHGNWEPIALRILFIRFIQVLRAAIDRVEWKVGQDRGALEQRLLDVRRQVTELLDGEERPSPATLLVLEERVAAAIARLGA